MAQLRLSEDNPRKYVQTLKCGRLCRGESAELSADNAISYLGTRQFQVTLSAEEVNNLSDKKLALAQRLLRLETKESTIGALLPEEKPKTVVEKVTLAVTSATPSFTKTAKTTLNKKVVKEEMSDEAILADDSE